MICIYDPLCRNLTHVPFNGALLTMVRHIRPHSPIQFVGEDHHIGELKRQMVPAIARSIQWVALPATLLDSPLNRLRLLAAHIRSAGLLILAAMDPPLLMGLKFGLARQSTGAMVILHSQLAAITGWRSRNPFVRMTDLRTAMGLGLSREKIQYLVLEAPIAQELKAHMPGLANHISVLEHPLPCHRPVTGPGNLSAPLKVGFLGIATRDKGFDAFLFLARQVQSIAPDRVEFHAVGSHSPGSMSMDLSCLHRPPSPDKLSKDTYWEILSTMHYICLPYDPAIYRFTASGILLDAIAAAIPVITFPLPMITALEQRFGPLGHVCPSLETMVQTLVRLGRDMDNAHYQSHRQRLQTIANLRTPEALAPCLDRILSPLYP